MATELHPLNWVLTDDFNQSEHLRMVELIKKTDKTQSELKEIKNTKNKQIQINLMRKNLKKRQNRIKCQMKMRIATKFNKTLKLIKRHNNFLPP